MRAIFAIFTVLLMATSVHAMAAPVDELLGLVEDSVEQTLPGDDSSGQEPGVPDEEGPGFDDKVREAFYDKVMMISAFGAVVAAASVAGFFMVTRYISPKEALKNPQRAMLYGFIRATPGAHLKQLSEEFGMKSSSILWHVRKLESADLVRSEHANGYRVFFPVEGGIELRRVSRAITALQNDNARRSFDYLHRTPGRTAAQIARSTGINAGTVRWHLRKMRDFGLIEELASDQASKYFATPLGTRSIETLEGRPTGDKVPKGTSSPLAHAET